MIADVRWITANLKYIFYNKTNYTMALDKAYRP